jgi:hypothetical protein
MLVGQYEFTDAEGRRRPLQRFIERLWALRLLLDRANRLATPIYRRASESERPCIDSLDALLAIEE